MTIQELFNMYLDTLDDTDKDEDYGTDRNIHGIGLKGFLDWLMDQPYEINVIKL
jgi:hypothetical protein